MKPGCYECKHRRDLSGDSHSQCRHPIAHKNSDPIAELLALLKRGAPTNTTTLGIVGNPHGIRNGWFAWPFNFDPIWLEACNGFEPKVADETPKP